MGKESAVSSVTKPPAAVPTRWKRSMCSESMSAIRSSAAVPGGVFASTVVRPQPRRSNAMTR